MKILSLFDGMSVAQQALKDAGIPVEVYYASEIDEYAMAVTQSNFPNTIQLGSVTDIGIDEVAKSYETNGVVTKSFGYTSYDLGRIDLLIGGSPCQDLSIAKKNRKGLDGSRSGLFWEYVRVLKEVKPKYFILENVNSMPLQAKEIITEALFGIEPVMINASLVSAQNRKRLFWVGKLEDDGLYHEVNISQPEDRGILLKDILEDGIGEPVALRNRGDGKKPEYNNTQKANALTTVQTDSMVSTIRLGQFGRGGQGDRIYSLDGKSVALSANGGGRGAKTGLYLIVPEATKKGYAVAYDGDSVDISFPTSKTRRGRVGQKAKNLMTSQNIGVFKDGVIRKLTPIECLRLQSMPDNYFDKAIYKKKPISNTQRYKMCGNAFNKEVIVHILKDINCG